MQIVLSQTQAAEVYIALDNLTGARVLHRTAIGVTPGASVSPVNHVVAHILRIGTRRQFHNLKRIDKAGRLISLIPPASPLNQRRLDRLWCARINIVDNGFNSLGPRRIGIPLLQSVLRHQANLQVFIDRGAVVLNSWPVSTNSRI